MKRVLRHCCATLLALALAACGTQGENPVATGDSGTGSIAVSAVWPDAPRAAARGLAAAPAGVNWVRVTVSGPGMTNRSQVFAAGAGAGTLTGVPVGSGRQVTLEGLAAEDGNPVYEGWTPADIAVQAGQTADGGTVVMALLSGDGTNHGPHLTSASEYTAFNGDPVTFTVTAADYDDDDFTMELTGLLANDVFTPTSPTSGTFLRPAAQAGIHILALQLTDDSMTTSYPITLTVSAVNNAPVLAAIGNQAATAGAPLSFIVSATDADGDTLTYSATGLPTEATLDSSTGAFSWTPGAAVNENFTITFTVSDGALSDSEEITISVGSVNRPPVLAMIGSRAAQVGELLSITISATDPDNDTLTYSAPVLPAGATFSGQFFQWTPTSGDVGNHTATFRVQDNGSPSLDAQEQITITITVPGNHAPVFSNAISESQSVNENQPLTFAVPATDADGDTLTYTSGTLPTGATFTASTQTFTWTPGYDQWGNYSVTFTVGDGVATDTVTVAITVTNVNRAPTVSDGALSVAEDAVSGTVVGTASATDADGDTLTYSITAGNATGVFAIGGSSGQITVSGSSTLDFETTAQFSLTVQVSDGALQNTATITVNVTDVNEAPVLGSIGDRGVNETSTLSVQLTATDPENATLAYSADVLPFGATLDTATGAFSWTPEFDQSGSYVITFSVGDGGLSASETITVVVADTLSLDIESTYLQYRTYEPGAGTDSYRGWVGLSVGGDLITEDQVSSVTLSHSLVGPVPPDVSSFWDSYYYGGSLGASDIWSVSGPTGSSGFWFVYPDPGFDPVSTYAWDVVSKNGGETPTETISFAGQIVLPVISSNTMAQQWLPGGDLRLSWQTDGVASDTNVDGVRVVIDDSVGDSLLMATMGSSQEQVILDRNSVDTLATLDQTGTLLWRMQTFHSTGSYHDARGYSAYVTLTPGAPSFALPDTGQTLGYSATPGGDSDYTINPPSYTDNGDGTVTDNVTGLVWQQNDFGSPYNWYVATGTADPTYNPGGASSVCGLELAGRADWRVPTTKELLSIVDYQRFNPAIDTTVFPTAGATYYWTADEDPSNGANAFRVWTLYGLVETPSAKASDHLVRCVRGPRMPGPVLVDNGDDTVSDLSTGFIWQKTEGGSQPWDAALGYCEGLDLGGADDWRVPNVKALASILDVTGAVDPRIDTSYFPGAVSDFYWTSTVFSPSSVGSDTVGFAGTQRVFAHLNTELHEVRCVRGGTDVAARPVADAGADTRIYVGTMAQLNGGGSAGASLTYHWSLASVPTGSGATLDDPASPTPSFTVDLPGAYVATLFVGDGTNYSAADSVMVTGSPSILLCGSSSRSIAALFPAFAVESGCVPEAHHSAMLVTRYGIGSVNGAELKSYLQGGGKVIGEWSINDELYNLAFDAAVVQGAWNGSCQDNIMPELQLTPSDPLWRAVAFEATADSVSGCGYDMQAFPAIVPLGGWNDTAGSVSLAYRALGAGRLWLVEADWQDPDPTFSGGSRFLLEYMITGIAPVHGVSRVGTPDPVTVFNDIETTYFYNNNLVNGIWHRPSDRIMAGYYSANGYWSYPAGTGDYPVSPDNDTTNPYHRMVQIPNTQTVIHTNAGLTPSLSSGIFVGSANLSTGALSGFQTSVFSDGFGGQCNLLSSSANELLCFDGGDIRYYATSQGSPNLTFVKAVTLSQQPLSPCAGSCYGGTFAWDGIYYYFASAGNAKGGPSYEVYDSAGAYVGEYTATGVGHINSVYFDWSVGRYVAHDGFGERTGGSTYTWSGGTNTDDSQCYGPVSTEHQ